MHPAQSFCLLSCGFMSHPRCLQEMRSTYTRINNITVAEREWRSSWRTGEKMRMQPLHLLTGSVLPLLPTIQKALERHRGPGGRVLRLKVRVCARGGGGTWG